MPHPLWPILDIVVRTPRLELRPVRGDADLISLYEAAKSGIHDPDRMPFLFPWTDKPSPEFEHSFFQWHARNWAEWTAEKWHLPLCVWVDGAAAGVQEVFAEDFAGRRTVESGSWLARSFQGRGYGTEMRAGMLHLAFEGLGAEYAESEAFEFNATSIAVSRRLGYLDNGRSAVLSRDKPVEAIKFRLDRPAWLAHRTITDCTIQGLDPCKELFGLAPPDGATGAAPN